MAIASKPTLLSLDQFAEIMQVSPFAINQLDISKLGHITDCGVWYQWAWQNTDTLNREILGYAISEAEHMVAESLGFWPAPRYTTAERISYPRPGHPEYWDVWYNERWKLNSVRTKYGKIWDIGAPVYTVISASTAVVLSDSDGDSVNDTFTIGPIATALTEECEIGVYVRDTDRPANLPADEECWRIRPVKVTISGGNLTITGSLWQLVDPDYYVSPVPTALDPTAAATFLAALKIQRRYTDITDQGSVSIEHVACNGTACSNIEVAACFGSRNADRGTLIPEATETSWPLGAPTCCSGNCYYAPDFVTVNYLSGHSLSQLGDVCRMEHLMAQIVARLAATLVPERYCGDCLEAQFEYWRELPGEDEIDALSDTEAGNSFGIRRGALWAWRRIQELNHNKKAGAIA